MKNSFIAVAALGIPIVTGCTTSLDPISPADSVIETRSKTAGEMNTVCAEKKPTSGNGDFHLQYFSFSQCQVAQKERQMSEALSKKKLRPEIFDLPLIVAGGAAGGFIIFEEMADALEITGLAAGLVGSFREYFNVNEVRSTLFAGIDGFGCLADAGLIAEQKMKEFHSTKSLYKTFKDGLSKVKPKVGKENEADQLRIANLEKFDAFYNLSSERFEKMPLEYRKSARRLSVELMRRVERKPVDYRQYARSLVEQQLSESEFKTEQNEANPDVPPASATEEEEHRQSVLALQNKNNLEKLSNLDELRQKLTSLEKIATVIASDIPDFESSMSSFSVCKDEALLANVE